MNIFYNIFIYPIQFFIEIIFYILKVHTESSNTVSIILLSIFVNIISLPLYKKKEKWLYIYNNSFFKICVYICDIFYIS